MKHQSGKKRDHEETQSSQLWNAYRQAEPYIGLGITFTLSVLGFLFLGRWLDSRLSTTPWLMIAGAALGLTLGFIHMISTINNLSGKNQAEDREENSQG